MLIPGENWVALGQGLFRTPGPTVRARTRATRLGQAILGCPVTRPAGLLTTPDPRGGTRGREMPPSWDVWGARRRGTVGTSGHTAVPHLALHVPGGGCPVATVPGGRRGWGADCRSPAAGKGPGP